MTANAQYTLHAPLPIFLVRGSDNAVTARLEVDGAPAAVTAATIRVINADGTDAVAATAATVTAGVVTYTIAAATLPTTLDLSGRWQLRWSFTITGEAAAVEAAQSAYLVRYDLHAPVREADLTAEHQGLADFLESGKRLQDFIDPAWRRLLRTLLGDGKNPSLVQSPFDLFDVLLHWCYELIFLDAATSVGDGQWQTLFEHHKAERERAYAELKFDYDTNQDGLVDSDETDRGARAVTFLGGPGRWVL